jgi:hypothetical protein
MKKLFFFFLAVAMPLAMYANVRLIHKGEAARIEVNGTPMLILGGELSNSAATSIADIDSVMPRMAAMGLNTVLVPAQWDLIEPTEGQFDFSLIDETVNKARENHLKVIFLWFGAWKNSMSCYAPMWFKENTKKYPRAMTAAGKPLEIASAFSEDVFQADNRAFAALMKHISATDRSENTVIMVQVENEIGMLEDARDHSPLANKEYNAPVPKELMAFLKKNVAALHPEMMKKWKENGMKTTGTWKEVFGSDVYGDEIFMAYYYARYVERLARTARSIHDIPLYVNAAMNSRGRRPGEYPSAGPLAHLIDVWHCGAPDIDILAPDIYDTGFKGWTGKYALKNNPLFIPESRCCQNSGVRAFYAFGEHQAVGFSAFAIDKAPRTDTQNIRQSFSLISQLTPLLLREQGRNTTHGILFDQEDKESVITDGDMTLTCRHNFTLPWDPRATDGTIWPEGGAILIKLATNDYVIAGNGVVVEFMKTSEREQMTRKQLGEDGFVNAGGKNSDAHAAAAFTGRRMGIGTVDEVAFDADGTMKYLRRLNGDEDHQGRHVRIPVGEYKILHVKLYEY